MDSSNLLREFIRSVLSERKARLLNGSTVDYGSRRHLKELDRIVSELDFLRRHMKKSERKERYTVSRAIDSLRHLKRKAERESAKKALLSEDVE